MSNKGALALLADYGGDSSDEEVPGTRVSTKRMHKDNDSDEENQTKRLERLPRPNFTIEKTEEVTNDPSLHEGRIRTFQHERGNWATYVYIPCEINEGLQMLLTTVIKVAADEHIELKSLEELHLSLTKTVVLRHHWIEPFVATLRENLAHFTKFIIMFNSLEVYCNEEKTRTFIGLQIKTGYDSLLKMVHCLDNCLAEFKLPEFYKDPSFHISIAWGLGDLTDQLKAILPQLNRDLDDLMTEYSQDNWYIYIDKLLCKTGNKIFQFHMK